MRKVAILERARTPYRPPLFRYVGNQVDLTVYYVGTSDSYRKWDLDNKQRNYDVKEYDSKNIGISSLSRGLMNDLIQYNPDEIITASEIDMIINSYIGYLAANKLDAELSVWTEYIHTPWLWGHDRPLYVRLAKRAIEPALMTAQKRLYKRAEKIIAYSDLAEQAAVEAGATTNKIVTAPPWYPPEILASPDPNRYASDSFRMLFVGLLSKRKGVDTLLDAARSYNSDDGLEFVIAGTGPMEPQVKAAAKNYDHISYAGYIDGTKKATEFAIADLFILPTRHDPWGQVVNEAYILDTPVATTTAAGAEMIVPDELLFSPGDCEELCSVIDYAKQNTLQVFEQPSLERMAKPLIYSANCL